MTTARPTHRLRPTSIEPFPGGAPGSILIRMGDTRVLCTASVSTDLPPHLKPKPGQEPTQGWITAEYAMLPGSTPQRKKRGSDGRATEIQRLIGRTLRAAIDLTKMPGVSITCDCDVIVADGGTRTAAITGAFVALAQAVHQAQKQGLIKQNPIHGPIAAVSVGLIDDRPHLDLDYALDVRAQVDMNVAMNHRGQLVEVQGCAEGATFSRSQLDALLNLAAKGIKDLMKIQQKTLKQMGVKI